MVFRGGVVAKAAPAFSAPARRAWRYSKFETEAAAGGGYERRQGEKDRSRRNRQKLLNYKTKAGDDGGKSRDNTGRIAAGVGVSDG